MDWDLAAYRRFAGGQALVYAISSAAVLLSITGLSDAPREFRCLAFISTAGVALALAAIGGVYAHQWRKYEKRPFLGPKPGVSPSEHADLVGKYYAIRQAATTLSVFAATLLASAVTVTNHISRRWAIVGLVFFLVLGWWIARFADVHAHHHGLVDRHSLLFPPRVAAGLGLLSLTLVLPVGMTWGPGAAFVAVGTLLACLGIWLALTVQADRFR